MPKNLLFNLIKLKKDQLSNSNKLSELTHSSGTPYFHFEFAASNPAVIGPYTLTSHHLSVYEDSMGNLESQSQYHYTAYFCDSQKRAFRLHVYFDEQDNILAKPFLAEVRPNNEFISVNCSEYDEAFKVLAQFSSSTLIKKLRNEQAQVISKIQVENDNIEKELEELSRNLLANKEEYLIIINTLIEKIANLLNYSALTRSQSSTLSCLKSIKVVVESMREEVEEIEELESAEDHIESHEKSKLAKAQRTKKSLIEKPAITQQLRFLQEELAKNGSHLPVLEKLYDDINSLEVDLIEKRLIATVDELKDLKQLKDQIENKAKPLLKTQILEGNFQDYKIFYPVLSPEDLMPMALFSNKVELLEFLLKNQIVDVHYKNFKIHNTHYNSMIDYCFRQTTDKSSKKECLSILIKYGASLFDIDHSKGLPYAALLLDSKHPLTKVLNENTENTVYNLLFFKQLNHILRFLLNQPDCTKARRKQINQLIKCNETRMQDIEFARNLKSPSISNLNQEIKAQVFELYSDDLINQLYSDQEYIDINRKIKNKTRQITSKVSVKEKLKIAYITSENQEDVKNMTLALRKSSHQISFDSLKKDVLQLLAKKDYCLDLYLEGLEVRKNIKPTNSNSKMNKNNKQAIARLNEINKEIEAYQGEFNSIVKNTKTNTNTNSEKNLNELNNNITNLEELNEINKMISEFSSLLINKNKRENKEKIIEPKVDEKLSASALNNPRVNTLFAFPEPQNSLNQNDDLQRSLSSQFL